MNDDQGERMNEQSTKSQEETTAQPVQERAQSTGPLLWLEQIVTWLSAVLLVLYVISGFGMTKPELVSEMTGGLITWRVAYDMHNNLYIPLILGFSAHTLLAIRRTFASGTQRMRTAGGIGVLLIVALLAYLLTMALS